MCSFFLIQTQKNEWPQNYWSAPWWPDRQKAGGGFVKAASSPKMMMLNWSLRISAGHLFSAKLVCGMGNHFHSKLSVIRDDVTEHVTKITKCLRPTTREMHFIRYHPLHLHKQPISPIGIIVCLCPALCRNFWTWQNTICKLVTANKMHMNFFCLDYLH